MKDHYALVLGLGRNADNKPTIGRPWTADPTHYEPIPKELEESVVNYVCRMFRNYRVDYVWQAAKAKSRIFRLLLFRGLCTIFLSSRCISLILNSFLQQFLAIYDLKKKSHQSLWDNAEDL